MVQWLGLWPFTTKGWGLIPGWGTTTSNNNNKRGHIKKNEIMPSATTRMDLEIVILIEVCQTEEK